MHTHAQILHIEYYSTEELQYTKGIPAGCEYAIVVIVSLHDWKKVLESGGVQLYMSFLVIYSVARSVIKLYSSQ